MDAVVPVAESGSTAAGLEQLHQLGLDLGGPVFCLNNAWIGDLVGQCPQRHVDPLQPTGPLSARRTGQAGRWQHKHTTRRRRAGGGGGGEADLRHDEDLLEPGAVGAIRARDGDRALGNRPEPSDCADLRHRDIEHLLQNTWHRTLFSLAAAMTRLCAIASRRQSAGGGPVRISRLRSVR